MTLMKTKKSKFLTKQFNEKSTKIKIMLNVIIYSINKFVKFNNIIINKLIIINKHIYEVLDQDININKVFKKNN